MQIQEIVLDAQTSCFEAKLGGGALIAESDWPKNPDGDNLTLILSLPCKWLNKIINTSLPEEYFLSVFSTYLPKDYFIDKITYSGDPQELLDIKAGYTKVVLHRPMAKEINLSEYPIAESAIKVFPKSIEEGCVPLLSFFSEEKPRMTQNKNMELSGLRFVCQIYAGRLPQALEGIFDLSDAVGYLFLDESNNNGLFFVQTA
ncbi:hypothetical protein [Chitinimonas lacunae]|uniref:DUF1963 domain-containing protein n=1 Tax=Chitinimonas lacunae TaxID=1963018 RepID=A0ABV8MVX3_9NEIS